MKRFFWIFAFLVFEGILGLDYYYYVHVYKYDMDFIQLFNQVIIFFVPIGIVCWIMYVFPKLNRQPWRSMLILSVIAYHISGIFVQAYFIRQDRWVHFDPFFLIFNWGGAWHTVSSVVDYSNWILLGVIIAVVLSWIGLNKFIKNIKGRKTWLGFLLFTGIIGLGIWLHLFYPNELHTVLDIAFKKNSEISRSYNQYYNAVIDQNKHLDVPEPQELAEDVNIFFIQMESVNGLYVDEVRTPQLMEISNQYGTLFTRVQSSSVQTIRAQESLLCSLLPSTGETLANRKAMHEDLVCLPQVLKAQGYKTLFFKSHELEFTNTGAFMQAIGFDEVHSDDIMQPGDEKLDWGYREDLFYQRVFEYLEQYEDEKLFVYIAVSTTNHFPFYKTSDETYARFKAEVPFVNPSDEEVDRYSDSMYIQDAFFGDMFHEYYFDTYAEHSLMWVFSDTAWPIAVHEGNFHNESSAFQEDFVTPLAIIFPTSTEHVVGQTTDVLISQLDFTPTLLEWLGLPRMDWMGISFAPLLEDVSNPIPEQCITAVQPFSTGMITQVIYPYKYIYHLWGQYRTTYNLQDDPDEMHYVDMQDFNASIVSEFERCYEGSVLDN